MKSEGEAKLASDPSRGAGEPKPPMTVWRALGLVALLTIMSLALGRVETLLGVENLVRDGVLSLAGAKQTDSRQIVIVAIDDDEHDRLFKGNIPAAADELRKTIERIADAGPALIAVDIETSDPVFRGFPRDVKGIPIVWARPATRHKEEAYAPVRVLGVDARPDDPIERASGATAFPVDPSKEIRTYFRQFITKEGRLDSFSFAIVRNYLALKKQSAPMQDDRIRMLSQWGGPIELEETGAESDHRGRAFEAYSVEHALKQPKRLNGKIVILGGVFQAGRDFHSTPRGRMAGVEVVGHAVETELRGGGPIVPGETATFLINIIVGVILIAAYNELPFVVAFLINAGIAAILIAMLFRRSSYSVVNFFPIPIVFFAIYVFHKVAERHEEVVKRVAGILRGHAEE
jgi:CHASE2 domain-containing sensor protein